MGINKFWADLIKEEAYQLLILGETVMVARSDLLNLLEHKRSSLKILGADGFKFDGEYLTPIMECMFDASYATPKEAIDTLEKLLADNEDWKTLPQFIELTLDD